MLPQIYKKINEICFFYCYIVYPYTYSCIKNMFIFIYLFFFKSPFIVKATTVDVRCTSYSKRKTVAKGIRFWINGV
jgi:hypothetical protein